MIDIISYIFQKSFPQKSSTFLNFLSKAYPIWWKMRTYRPRGDNKSQQFLSKLLTSRSIFYWIERTKSDEIKFSTVFPSFFFLNYFSFFLFPRCSKWFDKKELNTIMDTNNSRIFALFDELNSRLCSVQKPDLHVLLWRNVLWPVQPRRHDNLTPTYTHN